VRALFTSPPVVGWWVVWFVGGGVAGWVTAAGGVSCVGSSSLLRGVGHQRLHTTHPTPPPRLQLKHRRPLTRAESTRGARVQEDRRHARVGACGAVKQVGAQLLDTCSVERVECLRRGRV